MACSEDQILKRKVPLSGSGQRPFEEDLPSALVAEVRMLVPGKGSVPYQAGFDLVVVRDISEDWQLAELSALRDWKELPP